MKEQILEMHAEGFEIGAHPLAHPDLTKCTEKEALEDVSRSRMLLEIIFNAPVKSFSFPGGRLNDSLKCVVAEAGFTNACSIWTGPARFFVDPFEIRRTVCPRPPGFWPTGRRVARRLKVFTNGCR